MTQTEAILNHLKDVGPLTPIDALRIFGCFRLSGRIKDLRDQGINIRTDMIESQGKHFAKYSLATIDEVGGQLAFASHQALKNGTRTDGEYDSPEGTHPRIKLGTTIGPRL